MAHKSPATMQRVAAVAGVSLATVSRALRNDPRLLPATRLRIQVLARKLGYRPHPAVASLMAHVRAGRSPVRVETLGFITAFPTREGWREASPMYELYRQGATEQAGKFGYELDEIWAKEPGMTGRRLSAILQARGIRGLLIAPMHPSKGHLSLDWSKFAAATMGYSLCRPDLPRAASDLYGNVLLALRQLRHHGYRRPGLLVPSEDIERVDFLPLGAFAAFQQKLRPVDRLPPLYYRTWDDQQFVSWFRRCQPDALLSGVSRLSRLVRSCGKRVPEDVGIVELQLYGDRSVAGINNRSELVGAAAADLVLGQLHRNELGIPEVPKIVLIRGAWVDGPTVRKPVG